MQQLNINGGLYTVDNIGSGAGVFTRVFGIDGSAHDKINSLPANSAQAYNDAVTLTFNQKTGGFNAALTVGQLPIVSINGTQYLQFAVSYNGGSTLTLTAFQVYVSPTAGKDFDTLSQIPGLGTKIYDLGANAIAISGYPSGNGNANMAYNIPLQSFVGQLTSNSVYVFARYDDITGGGYEQIAFDPGGTPVSTIYPVIIPSTPEARNVWGGLLMGTLLIGGVLKRRFQKPALAA